MLSIPATRYAKSGDVSVAYQVTGSGSVDLVWAPGTTSHLDLEWESPPRARFYERLGAFCRLIRFDKRGTGLSDRPAHIATLEERTDDIRAVMDAAGSARAAVIGVSEGSSMASLFAATFPDRVSGLLIWGGQARWTRTADYPWGQTAEEAEREIQQLAQHGVTRDYLLGPGAGIGPDADPVFVDWFLRYARAGASPAAVAALERMNNQIDLREVLPTIKIPTLVMNRTGDPVADVNAARDLAGRIPGARFVEFPGNTHSMFTLDPERVIVEIEQFMTGSHKAVRTDRLLASILFLDIVGSTERASALGDAAWSDVLARHDAAAEREVEAYSGHVVDHAGDGLLATFDGPARGIRCAHAIQRTALGLNLQVRAGLHTGEVEKGGTGIRGIAVHTAARIASLAGPQEILVSGTVKDLVAGSGIGFAGRGVHALKGISEPRQIYAVTDVTW